MASELNARPGTEWARNLCEQADAGNYRSKSMTPLDMAREVMRRQNPGYEPRRVELRRASAAPRQRPIEPPNEARVRAAQRVGQAADFLNEEGWQG